MELSEYLAIRKAYNLARREMASVSRLTFAEYAILVFLSMSEKPVRISQVAEYQDSLRPTMTHRIKHLAELGLVRRSKGDIDARNILCEISPEGRDFLSTCVDAIIVQLRKGDVLSRIQAKRVMNLSIAMGTRCYMSGDLVLLGIAQSDYGDATISELVKMLGLLQPTVSMSVTTLERQGLATRLSSLPNGGSSNGITLTEEGLSRVDKLLEEVASIVVRRYKC